MLTYFIIFLSLFSANAIRVIGDDPKTWSPSTELDCSTCKVILTAIGIDACSKCPDPDKCAQMFSDPTKICQFIGICPKTIGL